MLTTQRDLRARTVSKHHSPKLWMRVIHQVTRVRSHGGRKRRLLCLSAVVDGKALTTSTTMSHLHMSSSSYPCAPKRIFSMRLLHNYLLETAIMLLHPTERAPPPNPRCCRTMRCLWSCITGPDLCRPNGSASSSLRYFLFH